MPKLTTTQARVLSLAVPQLHEQVGYRPSGPMGYVCYVGDVRTGNALVRLGLAEEVGDRAYRLTEAGEAARLELITDSTT